MVSPPSAGVREHALRLLPWVLIIGIVGLAQGPALLDSTLAAWALLFAAIVVASAVLAVMAISDERDRGSVLTVLAGVVLLGPVAGALVVAGHVSPPVEGALVTLGWVTTALGMVAWLYPPSVPTLARVVAVWAGVLLVVMSIAIALADPPSAMDVLFILRLVFDIAVFGIVIRGSLLSTRGNRSVVMTLFAAGLGCCADLMGLHHQLTGVDSSLVATCTASAAIILLPAALLHDRVVVEPTTRSVSAITFNVVGVIAVSIVILLMPAVHPEDHAAMARSLLVLTPLAALVIHANTLLSRKQDRSDFAERRSRLNPDSGLPNRVAFEEDVAEGRVAGPAAILVIVIDGLDTIRALSDTALQRQAEDEIRTRLVRAMHSGERLYHWESDRFLLVLPEAEACRRGEELVELCRRPVHVDEIGLAIDAAVGISVGSLTSEELDRSIREALLAAMVAAGAGNAVGSFSGGDRDRLAERLRLIARLRRAPFDGSLVLHYQPVIDTRTGEVAAVEALVRWRVDGILMRPDHFLPLAEETGLIVDIGRWVLDTALSDISRLRREQSRFAGTAVSVNCSARQLQEPGFGGIVTALLAQHDLPPEALWLELTETTLISDTEGARSVLVPLADHGVRITLDDFGVGYSALSNLTDFPISVVKLDRSFTVTLLQRDDAISAKGTVARSVISMVAGLGIDVVAEGVENEVVYRNAVAYGCRYSQGWYHALPAPISDYGITAAPGRSPR